MKRRLLEQRQARELIRGAADFTVRGYVLDRAWVIVGFTGVLAVVFLISNLAVHGELLSPLGHAVIAFAMLAFLIFLFYRLFFRVTLAEFQSLVFSSSLKTDTMFCMIFSDDRRLFYGDYRYVDLFGDRDISTLDALFSSGGFNDEQIKTVEQVLETGTGTIVDFSWPDTTGQTRSGRLAVYPLARPRGFFLLKATAA
jgi:hypothetical protein